LNFNRIPIETLINPKINDAFKLVRNAIEKKKTVLIVGLCRVDYEGRASSTLDYGERIVIIKIDGSIQVHRPWEVNPVNWQPPGCIFHVNLTRENLLRIRAIRKRPHEIVNVFFKSIYLVSSMDLIDEAEFSLYASEQDMQKAIILEPSLFEEGFKVISYEKPVEPGFIDLYGIDSSGRFVVIELKRRPADKNAVIQLAKYVEEIKKRSPYRKVRGVLVAPDVHKGVLTLLKSLGLEFKRLDPRKCSQILKSKSRETRLTDFFHY